METLIEGLADDLAKAKLRSGASFKQDDLVMLGMTSRTVPPQNFSRHDARRIDRLGGIA